MMDIDPPAQPQAYTILRIKRKRTDEPLDALVVDSVPRARRRKIKGGFDVFQFAETIERGALEDEEMKRDLQRRVAALVTVPVIPEEKKGDEEKEKEMVAPAPPQVLKKDDPKRTYTVVQQEQPGRASPRRGGPINAPPKVISHKDLLKPKQDFTYYDAVLASEKKAKEEDEEMMNFMPMLEEYLKISDVTIPSSSDPPGRSTEEDYVWDIFYHRPAKVDEWSKIAANIGTLTGLPASFGHPDDSDSDEEPEDDEDEDSNAEDNYKNDYPDEDDWDDSDDSDAFHDGSSEHDELFANDDNASDEEWMNSTMRMR